MVRLTVAFAATALLANARLVVAADGVIEINQACATATGCFPGDGAGFPVTIGQAGSYRLTSNLRVTSPDTSAVSIEGQGVTLDLGGFEVSGPGSCSGDGSGLVCTGGVARVDVNGISGSAMTRVQDGSVRGFHGYGVRLFAASQADNLRLTENQMGGISVEGSGFATRVISHRNAGYGISLVSGTIEKCVSTYNKIAGIATFAAVVSESVSFGNGAAGCRSRTQSYSTAWLYQTEVRGSMY